MGFPSSSVGKESACNAGDPGSIPGSGRSPGERIGYPLQYSWGSPRILKWVTYPPATQETWVWSLGWEDPLEEGMATHSSILAWRILMDRGAWQATVHGVSKNQTLNTLRTLTFAYSWAKSCITKLLMSLAERCTEKGKQGGPVGLEWLSVY